MRSSLFAKINLPFNIHLLKRFWSAPSSSSPMNLWTYQMSVGFIERIFLVTGVKFVILLRSHGHIQSILKLADLAYDQMNQRLTLMLHLYLHYQSSSRVSRHSGTSFAHLHHFFHCAVATRSFNIFQRWTLKETDCCIASSFSRYLR